MTTDQDTFAVILAGGSGTRFWPKSRQKKPKQLCALGGEGQTLIEGTLSRLDSLTSPDKRWIVTHRLQAKATEKIVGPRVQAVLAEPSAKNTAAALILAALEIRGQSSDEAVMSSFHADHHIIDHEAFASAVRAAQASARSGRLALVGIKPSHPDTGFGYIEKGGGLGPLDFSVESFREKPDLATAEAFVSSGRFLWNSGMFHWQVGVFLEECRRLAPQSVDPLERLFKEYGEFAKIPSAKLAETYASLPNVAVDNAILEKSEKMSVVVGDFEWHDVGSWSALSQAYPGLKDASGNVEIGNTLLLDCRNVTTESDGPLLVGLGLEDLVLVHCDGAILVCPKSRAQDVKLVVEELKRLDRGDLV